MELHTDRILIVERRCSKFAAELLRDLRRHPKLPRLLAELEKIETALLARVESLGFDGGNEIYHYIWYHWDGESNDFDLETIRGIEHCPQLRRFNEISMVKHCDLALLRPLVSLESIELAPGAHPNARALLDLPRLQSLKCFADSLDDPDVVVALRARGVAVRIWT